MICKLISVDSFVPNQTISDGDTLTIGRNRQCKIKDLKCPRNYCIIQLKGPLLQVKVTKTDAVEMVKSGDFLNGPGFSYKIKIIEPQLKGISLRY